MHPAAPSLVVGFGRFGAAVAERLAQEAASSLRDAREGNPEVMAWAEELRERGLDLVLHRSGETASAFAERVTQQARRVLAHARLASRRDAPGRDGPTRLHVLVLAHLDEAPVRRALPEALAAIERDLLTKLGPIFEQFRVHARRNLVVLPILAMPHPAAHAQGEEVRATVNALATQVAATPPRSRAVPQIYLLEDVAEFSVLSEPELQQAVRNFASLLLYALPSLESGDTLLYGRQPDEPLATFACAVAEIPRAKLRRYGIHRVALEVLEAIENTPRTADTLQQLDILEEVELASLDTDDSSENDIREILERYAPQFPRDPEPKWYTRSETLRERYGADHGDMAAREPQGPAEPPVGWALERMQEIESGWRLLQRRRFDDLIASERRAIEERRDALRGKIRTMVDQTLWRDPTPEGFRRAAERVDVLGRAIDERLEDAVRIRDAIDPPPAPRFDAFRNAHGMLLDAARQKPDLGRMLLFGLLAVTAFVSFAPELLWALADATGAGPADWYNPWLRERAPWTGLIIGMVLVGGGLVLRYRSAVRELRERFMGMWRALEDTVGGAHGSLLNYFATRLKLARQVSRVEALLSLRATLDRDRERLTLLDRAVRRARARLLEEQRALGVERAPDGTETLARLLGQGHETLVEAMVGSKAAERLRTALPFETQRTRVRDVLGDLARELGYAKRWREEVPFTDLDALRRVCAPYAEPVAEWDPLSDPGGTDDVADAIAAFVRRQARSLRVALRYSGRDASDPTGISEFLRGEAIVPPAIAAAVESRLADEGAAGRVHIPVHAGLEPDRAYYIVATGDIHPAAVASLMGEDDA
ncbi:MAG: hypothetical protein AAGE52_20560 [Myxococcota bacterium]